MAGGGRENIRVLVRIRPDEVPGPGPEGAVKRASSATSLASTTSDPGASCVKQVSQGSIEVVRGDKPRDFHFDRVFGPSADQRDVYDAVDPLVASTVQGYNATIFAYGSTGSGKTHTISGAPGREGIIPRAVNRIFELAGELADREADGIVLVHMGYVELYNNQFKDLLYAHHQQQLTIEEQKVSNSNSSSSIASANASASASVSSGSRPRIELHTSKSGNVFLTGSPSLHTPVTSAKEALRLIQIGARSRAVGATDCNEHSSRSHAILTFYVESRVPGPDGAFASKLGKLHLVDLAGSERLTLSKAQGQTLTETQNINLSLSTLGDVLSALSRLHSPAAKKTAARRGTSSSAADRACVPYRNSKLTFLLKDSLGGNSKTLMIATIRTPALYAQQTLMTLMYAERAKKIENRIRLNTDTEGDSKAAALVAEVERLKSQLRQREADFERLSRQTSNGIPLDAAGERHRIEQLARLARENELEKERLEACLRQVVHNHASTLNVQQEKYSSLQVKLAEYKDVFDKQRVEIETLRESIRELAKGATEDEVEEMKAMVEKLARALGAARQDALAQTDRATRLENQLRVARERLLGQSSQQGAAQLQVDELRDQLKTSRHQYEALKSASVDTLRELERMRRAEAVHQAQIAELQDRCAAAPPQPAPPSACRGCAATARKYDAAIAALHEEIRETLVDKDAQLKDLSRDRDQLRAQVAELDKQKQTVLAAASEAQTLAGEMQRQRDEARAQLERARQSNETVQALQTRLAEAQREAAAAHERSEGAATMLRAAHSRLQAEYEGLQGQHTILRRQHDQLRDEHGDIKAREGALGELEQTVAQLQARLATADRITEQKSSRVAELDAQLEREREAASGRERDMRDKTEALHREISALKAQASKHSDEMDNAQHRVQRLEDERNALASDAQGRTAQLAQELQDAKDAQHELRETLLAALDEAAKARTERDTALDRAETLIQQAQQKAQARIAGAYEALEADRDEALLKLQQAEARIGQAEEALRKAETNRKEALERATSQARDMVSAHEQRARAIAAEKDEVVAQISALRKEIEASKAEACKRDEEARRTRAAQQDEVREARAHSAALEEQLRDLRAEVPSLQQQLRHAKESYEEVMVRARGLEKERDEALEKLSRAREALSRQEELAAGLRKAGHAHVQETTDLEGAIAALEGELARAVQSADVQRKEFEARLAVARDESGKMRKDFEAQLADQRAMEDRSRSAWENQLGEQRAQTEQRRSELEAQIKQLRRELSETQLVVERLTNRAEAAEDARAQTEQSVSESVTVARKDAAQARQHTREAKEEAMALKEKLGTMREDLQRLVQERDEARASVLEGREALSKARSELDRARNEASDRESALSQARDDLSALAKIREDEVGQLKTDLHGRERELHGRVEALARTKTDLERLLETRDQELADARQFLRDCEEALDAGRGEIRELARKRESESVRAADAARTRDENFAKLQNELSECQEALRQARAEVRNAASRHDETLGALQGDLRRRDEALRRAEKLVQAREEALAAAKNEFRETTRNRDEDLAKTQEELRKVLLAHDKATAKTRQDRNEAQRAAEAASATSLRAEEALTNARHRVSELERLVDRLEREKADWTAANEAREGQILEETALRAELEAKVEENRSLRAALQSSANDAHIWSRALEVAADNSLVRSAPTSLADAARIVETLLEYRSSTRERLEELSATCRKLEDAQKDRELELTGSVAALENEVERAQEARERSQRDAEGLAERLKVQNEWVQDLKSQRDDLEEKLAASAREVKRLLAALEDVGHIQQELGCLRAENSGLKAAHTDRLARAEAACRRLEDERRADKARLAQYASKLDRVRDAQRNWVQDRHRVKRVMAEAMAGMYGSLEGIVERLGQKRLETRVARLGGQVEALTRRHRRMATTGSSAPTSSVSSLRWKSSAHQGSTAPPLAPQARQRAKKQRVPISDCTNLPKRAVTSGRREHLARHGREIKSELRAVRRTQEQLLQEVKEQENTGASLVERAVSRRSRLKSSLGAASESGPAHLSASLGPRPRQQAPSVEGRSGDEDLSEDSTTNSNLGGYKLGVLNACLRGDLEGLSQALNVGFIRSDFDANFLPLHRTISGYHFHGSSERVIKALKMMVRKGAPVDARDVAGNTVLHKAIQVMPGDTVVSVLRALLRLGADPAAANKLGDTPVHTELRRLRSASPSVIRELEASRALRPHRSLSGSDARKVPAPADLLEAILQESPGEASPGHLELLQFLRAGGGA